MRLSVFPAQRSMRLLVIPCTRMRYKDHQSLVSNQELVHQFPKLIENCFLMPAWEALCDLLQVIFFDPKLPHLW